MFCSEKDFPLEGPGKRGFFLTPISQDIQNGGGGVCNFLGSIDMRYHLEKSLIQGYNSFSFPKTGEGGGGVRCKWEQAQLSP